MEQSNHTSLELPASGCLQERETMFCLTKATVGYPNPGVFLLFAAESRVSGCKDQISDSSSDIHLDTEFYR